MKQFLSLSFSLIISINLFAQNVGIGNTNPQAKLDITGNIKIVDGTQGDGKVLTSNATGVATWQKAAGAALGSAGFGAWGDCATNAVIGEYNPVSPDDAGGPGGFNLVEVGTSVSILGDFAAVGSSYASPNVYIYKYNASTSVWDFYQKLVSNVIAGFGQSVCLSGDFLIIGADYDNAGLGSASIYKNIAGVWTFQTQLSDNSPVALDQFGVSVSMSGDYAIVGALGDDISATNQGSASIFKNTAGVWNFQTKLQISGPAANDNFGSSVCISGDYIIVGAPNDDDAAGVDQGSASIYKNIAGAWIFQSKFFNRDAAAGDNFGSSVFINGDYAVVGAPADDDDAGVNQGSASFYKNIAGVWTLQAKVLKPSAAVNDGFGNSVTINAEYAIVGCAADDDISAIDQGSATIYKRLGSIWQKYQSVLDPAGVTSDLFGKSVSIDAVTKRFLIGAPSIYPGANDKGKAIFGKIN
jgi:FG-GAP repeat